MMYISWSIDAWQQCQRFINEAKNAGNLEDSKTLQWIAAMWRAKHEMLQAQYFAEVRP